MPTPKLASEIITAAIEGFKQQKKQINEQLPNCVPCSTAAPQEP